MAASSRRARRPLHRLRSHRRRAGGARRASRRGLRRFRPGDPFATGHTSRRQHRRGRVRRDLPERGDDGAAARVGVRSPEPRAHLPGRAVPACEYRRGAEGDPGRHGRSRSRGRPLRGAVRGRSGATRRRLARRRGERLDRLRRFVTGSRPSVGATWSRCPRIGLLRGGESRRWPKRCCGETALQADAQDRGWSSRAPMQAAARSNSSRASRRESSPVQRGVHIAGASMQPIAAARPLRPSGRTRRARSRRDR